LYLKIGLIYEGPVLTNEPIKKQNWNLIGPNVFIDQSDFDFDVLELKKIGSDQSGSNFNFLKKYFYRLVNTAP